MRLDRYDWPRNNIWCWDSAAPEWRLAALIIVAITFWQTVQIPIPLPSFELIWLAFHKYNIHVHCWKILMKWCQNIATILIPLYFYIKVVEAMVSQIISHPLVASGWSVLSHPSIWWRFREPAINEVRQREWMHQNVLLGLRYWKFSMERVFLRLCQADAHEEKTVLLQNCSI